jgi:very-short-patch-repair endonuclease
MRRCRNGLALTSPGRTLVDLAASAEESKLQRAMEDAFRRRISSPSEVRRALRYLPRAGKAGTGRATHALDRGEWSHDAQSELERRALELFRRHGLPRPQSQYRVVEDERCLGVVDFAWPSARVIVEAEGFQFHSGRDAWDSDVARYNGLALKGWTVLRLTQTDLESRASAFARALARIIAAHQIARPSSSAKLGAASSPAGRAS